MSTIPDDCGDAFCLLYDRLLSYQIDGRFGAATVDRLREQCQPGKSLHLKVTELQHAVEQTGTLPASDYTVETAVAALVAIDAAVGSVDSHTAGRVPRGLARLSQRIVDTGRLNARTPGALLLRRPRVRQAAAHANDLAGLFPRLVRVGADDWARVGLALPELAHVPGAASRSQVSVASLPWFTAPDDLCFGQVDPARALYSVWPSDTLDRAHRVRDGLRALDASDAVLGLVPESTLDEETLKLWIDAIRDTASTYDGNLRWILAGTGFLNPLDATGSHLQYGSVPTEPMPGVKLQQRTNKAVVLDRLTGEIVLTQDKNPGFTITPALAKKYKQEGSLGSGANLEWLDSSSRLWFLELPLGRVAILVCEALARLTTTGALIGGLSPDIVLSPLLAMNLKKDRWAHRSAMMLARDFGASVAVFNSKGLERDNDLSVSTMLTVVPTESVDEYDDPRSIFVPEAGQIEFLDKRSDAVTARRGEIWS